MLQRTDVALRSVQYVLECQRGPRAHGRRTNAAQSTDMKERASIAHFGLEYQAFLFAPLGDDGNGTPLAIASILGRMSLDPWHEAAALAALPADVAAKKLASFIDAMPDRSLKHPGSAELAARLVKLLPAPHNSAVQARDLTAAAGAKQSRGLVVYAFWFAIFCVLLLGASLANAARTPDQHAHSVIPPGQP